MSGPATHLAFLHTATAHVSTFGELMAEIAPDVPVRHVVRADLLDDARAAGGVDAALDQKLRGALAGAARDGAGVVVCTCSTLGDAAERIGPTLAPRAIVQRLDRAMAERAVARAAAIDGRPGRIAVLAALEATLASTRALLESVARRRGADVALTLRVIEGAWPKFERDDVEGYASEIERAVRVAAPHADVVVLAQASMAEAALRCADLGVPVLASPRPGVEDAATAFRAARDSSA